MLKIDLSTISGSTPTSDDSLAVRYGGRSALRPDGPLSVGVAVDGSGAAFERLDAAVVFAEQGGQRLVAVVTSRLDERVLPLLAAMGGRPEFMRTTKSSIPNTLKAMNRRVPADYSLVVITPSGGAPTRKLARIAHYQGCDAVVLPVRWLKSRRLGRVRARLVARAATWSTATRRAAGSFSGLARARDDFEFNQRKGRA